MILGLFEFSTHAAQNIGAVLKADPTSYSGTCPGKILFNGQITVSDKTVPPLGALDAAQVEDQITLAGPGEGKLQLKLDADNQIAEFRKDNNITPLAVIRLRNSMSPLKNNQIPAASTGKKPLNPGETKGFNPQPEPPAKPIKKVVK